MSETIALRPLTVADAEVMVTVLADPALYRFTGGQPPTQEELTRRYTAQTRGWSSDGSQRWINSIITLGPAGRAIGFVQATVPTDGGPAEIAWVIGKPWQGNGYARRAVALLLDDLATQGVCEVVAHIHPEHVVSQRVARRMGLSPTTTVVDGEVRWRRSRRPRPDAMDVG